MSKLAASTTQTTSPFGPRTTSPKVPNWIGYHQLSHLTPCSMTNRPQQMTLQVSDFTKLCSLFAKHCLSLSIGRQPSFLVCYTGINHTVQSYTAAEVFDNKENSSSTEARKPCGFCKACKPCLASDIKRQNGKRPLQCQRPQAIGPASKTAKFSVAEAM